MISMLDREAGGRESDPIGVSTRTEAVEEGR
jgi:hypothetical protein